MTPSPDAETVQVVEEWLAMVNTVAHGRHSLRPDGTVPGFPHPRIAVVPISQGEIDALVTALAVLKERAE